MGRWVLERCASERFPYRLQVSQNEGRKIILRVQDRWPAAGRNIFCLRETEPPPAGEVLETVEDVVIVALQRRGIRLSVVLDRPRYKRCDFLFLKRKYKGKQSEEYEQIFWQTQQSMRQRRPAVRLASRRVPAEITIKVASEERYPWRFPGSAVQRGRLDAGDYALITGGRVLAVVERKTFENFLSEIAVMTMFHQKLLELSTYEQHALVVEAPYEDFLNTGKVHHFTTAFCAAAIAELYAAHPRLRIVFCANRKTANEWTRNYFSAVSTASSYQPERFAEASQGSSGDLDSGG